MTPAQRVQRRYRLFQRALSTTPISDTANSLHITGAQVRAFLGIANS